jgi:hypothetical protein
MQMSPDRRDPSAHQLLSDQNSFHAKTQVVEDFVQSGMSLLGQPRDFDRVMP